MHSILGDIAAGKLPKQTPVDEPVRIERPVWPAVEEGRPVHILRRAIGRNRTHPLALAVGSVAAHPRIYLRNFSDNSVLDPPSRVGQCTSTFPLQADLDHAVGILHRVQALVSFWDRPRHGFLGIKIFARGQSVEKMPGVGVQWASHDDSVEVFHVEQAPMIIKCLNAGRHLLSFVVPPGVDVGDGHQLGVAHRHDFVKQILPAVSHAYHPDADTIICAEYPRSRIRQKSCCTQGCLLEKITSAVVCHDGVLEKLLTTPRHLAKVFSYLPNSDAMTLLACYRRSSEFLDSPRIGSHRA